MEQRMIYTIFALILALTGAIGIYLYAMRRFLGALSSGGAETPAPTTNDRWRWFSFLGNQPRLIESGIAQLRQSEHEHRTRYKILTENVAAAVMLHEADGTIVWCSPFTEVLTGFPLSEIYRNKESFLKSNVHEEDRATVERSLRIVATGEPFQCRYRLYHKSGITLWVETRTVPILDTSADEYVALSITIDVTAQVINQLQIEERNKDLNEFTYMLSHDLKSPILTITGMLGLLEGDDSVTQSRQLSEPIAYIRKATNRLQELVNGVLELARITAAERSLEPVPLDEVVREVLDDHQLQITESCAQITKIEELPVVLGNKTQLYQVFSNLIGNAIKYKSSDRPLIISINPERSVSRRKTSIRVSDNGRGISAERLETIFKPFNRAGEEAIEGTGVGLASVKKLVEKLGGSIHVDSAVGGGTSFTIELRQAPHGE
jgi:PAS domain S-box-containing protein